MHARYATVLWKVVKKIVDCPFFLPFGYRIKETKLERLRVRNCRVIRYSWNILLSIDSSYPNTHFEIHSIKGKLPIVQKVCLRGSQRVVIVAK